MKAENTGLKAKPSVIEPSYLSVSQTSHAR